MKCMYTNQGGEQRHASFKARSNPNVRVPVGDNVTTSSKPASVGRDVAAEHTQSTCVSSCGSVHCKHVSVSPKILSMPYH